jgi:hypothetical protein
MRTCYYAFPVLLFTVIFAVGCGSESDAPATPADAGVPDSDVADVEADADPSMDADAADVDANVEIPTTRSAFGIFAGFTSEFSTYEQAAGMSHTAYLDWAGQQYDQVGARWTRSNLQLLWDVLEPDVGGPYDWSNQMGTEECFSAAAAADVHYLPVFHEGGLFDEQLRNPLEQLEDYQQYVRDVVERYDGDGVDDAPGGIRITHWQVGNETPKFSRISDGADIYAAWFTATAEAVRDADPDAKLVLIGSTDATKVDPIHLEIIPRLAAQGVRFDAVDIHHWGTATQVEIEAAPEYQALFDSLGLLDVELWSTEHGTYVGHVAHAEGQCVPACVGDQICVQVGPEAHCVPPCTSDSQCPSSVPECDQASGWCTQPDQSLTEQARSLVQRYVVNRDRGVSLIMWNNLVAWHGFGGQVGGVYDRMGLVSAGFLEFETEADRGQPRPSWYAFQSLAARTDELWAERLGPVDVSNPMAYVSAYRNRKTDVVGWAAWSLEGTTTIERQTEGAAVRVTSFIMDESGTPTRDETLAASGEGGVSVPLDIDPVWIEPQP